MQIVLDIGISGVLMGLIYALLALGLTVIFGIMDTVNFAHGEFLMLGMYAGYLTYAHAVPDPLMGVPVAGVVGMLLGMLSYKLLVNRLLTGPPIAQIFGTFGLMLFLRYGALAVFGPNLRSATTGLVVGKRLLLGGLTLDAAKVVAAVGSALLFGLVYYMLRKSRLGLALQATSTNREAARYMGINTEAMNLVGWALGGATAGMAGALLVNFYYVSPTVGMVFAMITFTTVALGGFGSVPGALVAGILVGLVEVFTAQVISPQLKLAVIYVVFFLVVSLRPYGLLGAR